MAHVSDAEHHKRKRHDDDNGGKTHSDRVPQPPPPQSGELPVNAETYFSALIIFSIFSSYILPLLPVVWMYERSRVVSRHCIKNYACNMNMTQKLCCPAQS
jgi:hypothetical protein